MIKPLSFALLLVAVLSFSGCGALSGSSHTDDRRYISIYESLDQVAKETRRSNFEREDQVVRIIYDEMLKGDHTNTLLKNDLEATKKQVNEVYEFLDNKKKELERIAAMDPETGEVMEPGERTATQNFLYGPNKEANNGRGNGAAYQIRTQVKDLVDFINGQTKEITQKRSLQPEPPYASPVEESEYQAFTWEYLTFEEATAAAALAEVCKLKLEVLSIESSMMAFYRRMTIGNWGTEVKLVVLESVDSREVDAGSDFVAELRLGELFRASQPEYETDGRVESGEDGSAIVRWKAQPALEVNEKGLGIQPYKVIVKVPTADGGYRNVTHEGQFYVRQ